MKDNELLIAILAQLEREKSVSIPQLTALLGVSEADVYDALETLVFAYDAASIRLDLRDTYASLDTHGTDRLLRLTEPEADALLDALASVGFHEDDELVRSVLNARSVFGGAERPSKPRLRVISEQDSPDIAQALAAACESLDHHLLLIAYRGIDDERPRERIVEPLRIFSDQGHRYLQAFCRESRGWRSFRVDRITRVQVLDEGFEPRPDAPKAGTAFEQDSLGARVILDADCPLPAWRGARVTRTQEDGSHVISIDWTGSSWLPKRIVALMGKATVLEPPELERACHDYARLLLAEEEGDEGRR